LLLYLFALTIVAYLLLLRSVYTEREPFIQSTKANAEHDFSLFYLDQRRQAAVAFYTNRPLLYLFWRG